MTQRVDYFEATRVSKTFGSVSSVISLDLTSCTHLNNRILLLGDVTGHVRAIDQDWTVSATFHAHEDAVIDMKASKQTIVTIAATNAKRWRWCGDHTELVSFIRLEHKIVSFAARSDLRVVAFGTNDGAVSLWRDASTSSSGRVVYRTSTENPVTGLVFGTDQTTLFCTSADGVRVFGGDVVDDQERTSVALDASPALSNGCVATHAHVAVAQRSKHTDMINFYTTRLRGRCFVVEGGTVRTIRSVRHGRYLLVETVRSKDDVSQVSLYDVEHHLVVFRFTPRHPSRLKFVVDVWDHVYLVTSSHEIVRLSERDTESKLERLFHANRFDMAKAVASRSNVSEMDVTRMYADHLYAHREFARSAELYVETLGHVEPSYVISRFLSSRTVFDLSVYLDALHVQCGKDRYMKEYTVLLLGCYYKLNARFRIENFANGAVNVPYGCVDDESTSKEPVRYDVDVVVASLRENGYGPQALIVAKRTRRHDHHLRILIEDQDDVDGALEYIRNGMPASEAKRCAHMFCATLMTKRPDETLSMIVSLLSSSSSSDENDVPAPHDFVPHFRRRHHLLAFLNGVTSAKIDRVFAPVVWNTLLELWLHEWSVAIEQDDVERRNDVNRSIREVLMRSQDGLNSHRALMVAQMYNHQETIESLLDKGGMHASLVDHWLDEGSETALSRAIDCCRRCNKPELWIRLLTHVATSSRDPQRVLRAVRESGVVSSLAVLDVLCDAGVSIGSASEYVARAIADSEVP